MSESKIDNDFIKFIEPEFIHGDDRGVLSQLSSKNKWSQVNYIKSEPGAVRGNHFRTIRYLKK